MIDALDVLAEAHGITRPSARFNETPDQRAERIIGLPKPDVLSDPLFLEHERATEREGVIAKMNDYHNGRICSSCSDCEAWYLTFRGRRMHAAEVWKLQHREAYNLLRQGASVREVAANLHLEVSQVEQIKQQFTSAPVAGVS